MTIEAIQQRPLEKQDKTSFLPKYPPCNGNPGSSDHNWVPINFIGYLIDKTLREVNQKKKSST